MTIPGILMIDRAGRRPLLIWGAVVSKSTNRHCAGIFADQAFFTPVCAMEFLVYVTHSKLRW